VPVHHGDIVVTMDDDPPTRQRTIRLDVDIDERLTAYARRTRRTVNATVNFLLGEALERAEPELAVHLNRPVRPLDV
jgi:macrodomain Ter protein organizer (MatP/YcbG family)